MERKTGPAVTKSIEAEGTAISRATPAAVFLLLKNSDTWPQWSIFNSAVLELAGKDEPYGVGAIRIFSTHISKAREQVTELIPNQKLSYVLLSGLPLRNYRADVCLISLDDGGTLINWTSSFQCTYGTGWFWRLFMNRILSDLTNRLAAAAQRAEMPDL